MSGGFVINVLNLSKRNFTTSQQIYEVYTVFMCHTHISNKWNENILCFIKEYFLLQTNMFLVGFFFFNMF